MGRADKETHDEQIRGKSTGREEGKGEDACKPETQKLARGIERFARARGEETSGDQMTRREEEEAAADRGREEEEAATDRSSINYLKSESKCETPLAPHEASRMEAARSHETSRVHAHCGRDLLVEADQSPVARFRV